MTTPAAILQTRQDAHRALSQQPIGCGAVLLAGGWFVTRCSHRTWCVARRSPWAADTLERWYRRDIRVALDIVFGSE